MKTSAPPACRVCGEGVSALDGDLCDSCTDDDFGLTRHPLHHTVGVELDRLGVQACVIASGDAATFAFSHDAINPVHWPTGTLLRWTNDAGWFLYDPAYGDIVHRFPFDETTAARAIAKTVLEVLGSGLPGEAVHDHDDSELEAALFAV